jgi:hypothetical protein
MHVPPGFQGHRHADISGRERYLLCGLLAVKEVPGSQQHGGSVYLRKSVLRGC